MDISFERLISFFFSKLKIVIIISVIVTVASYLFSDNMIQKKYTSSSALMITMNVSSSQSSNNELTVTKNLVENYIRTLYTNNFFSVVARSVNEELGTDYTSKSLKSSTSIKSASSDKASSDFNINYTSNDPVLSQKILTIITNEALTYIESLGYSNKLDCIEDPTLPTGPSSPNPRNNAIYAFLISFVGSMAVFYFVEIFDTRIKNVQDISATYNVSILGVIPDYASGNKKRKSSYYTYEETAAKEENK